MREEDKVKENLVGKKLKKKKYVKLCKNKQEIK